MSKQKYLYVICDTAGAATYSGADSMEEDFTAAVTAAATKLEEFSRGREAAIYMFLPDATPKYIGSVSVDRGALQQVRDAWKSAEAGAEAGRD